jgi:AcrR family transcriptional regulator
MLGTQARRAKERNRRIKTIEAAAKAIFFKKGYFDTTIDEIASRAELSKGTLYYYFKNKDELYVLLMMPMIEKLGRQLADFEKKLNKKRFKNANAVVMGFHDIYAKTLDYDPDGLKIFQIFQLNNFFSAMSKEAQKRVSQVGKRNMDTSRRIISKAIQLGLLPEIDPIQLTDLFFAILLGVVQLEESKLEVSKKDHLKSTLHFGFSLLATGKITKKTRYGK